MALGLGRGTNAAGSDARLSFRHIRGRSRPGGGCARSQPAVVLYAMIGISAGIGGVTLGEQAMRSTPEERQHRARLAQKRLIRHGLTGVAIVVVAVAIALLTR